MERPYLLVGHLRPEVFWTSMTYGPLGAQTTTKNLLLLLPSPVPFREAKLEAKVSVVWPFFGLNLAFFWSRFGLFLASVWPFLGLDLAFAFWHKTQGKQGI